MNMTGKSLLDGKDFSGTLDGYGVEIISEV